jgi:hypothetical protein
MKATTMEATVVPVAVMAEEPVLQATTIIRAHGGMESEGRGVKISPMTWAIPPLCCFWCQQFGLVEGRPYKSVGSQYPLGLHCFGPENATQLLRQFVWLVVVAWANGEEQNDNQQQCWPASVTTKGAVSVVEVWLKEICAK